MHLSQYLLSSLPVLFSFSLAVSAHEHSHEGHNGQVDRSPGNETTFSCSLPLGARKPHLPHGYSSLQDYCKDPHGINATCSGAIPTIDGISTPPSSMENARGDSRSTVEYCWMYCKCGPQISVAQSSSTDGTSNNVQANYREKQSSKESASRAAKTKSGASVEGHGEDQSRTSSASFSSMTTASNITVTNGSATVTSSGSSSVTQSTMHTTTSRPVEMWVADRN